MQDDNTKPLPLNFQRNYQLYQELLIIEMNVRTLLPQQAMLHT